MLGARRRAARAEVKVREAFPDYPFEHLDDLRVRNEARAYLKMKLGQVAHTRIRGMSEIVLRSTKLPDRRLDFSDQQLQQRLREHAAETLAMARLHATEHTADEAAGQFAADQTITIEPLTQEAPPSNQ